LAGALPQIPLGELTALPKPPSWISGVSFQAEGEGKGDRKGGEEKGKVRGREGEGEEGREGEDGRGLPPPQ